MKKIMFNDEYGLTQAVLEGRKTKTRRIINAPENATGCELLVVQKQHREYVSEKRILMIHTTDHVGVKIDIPYQVGDEVAIAQKYSELEYGVDWVRRSINKEYAGWNNKLFVSAKEMPHRIKITNLRIERLQDISEEDCLKEGIVLNNGRYIVEKHKGVTFFTTDARLAFKYLIDKTYGKGTWDSNPYVFVYDFELVK